MNEFNPRFGMNPISVLSSWSINQVNKDMSVLLISLEARALSNHRSIFFSDTYQPCVSHKSGIKSSFKLSLTLKPEDFSTSFFIYV